MAGKKGMKNGRMRGDEFLVYESVKNWLQSAKEGAMGRGKSGLTKEAKMGRLKALANYVEFSNLNPDELLGEAKEDIKNAMNRLTDFFNWLQGKGEARPKKMTWNSACTIQARIRGFYTHNDVTFPKRFKTPRRMVSAVSKRDTKTAIFDYDEDKDEIVYKNGMLQHFVSNLNFRDQTIALCLLSTGADAADLLRLNAGFVKDSMGKISTGRRLLWHDNRSKDGIEFKVYLSAEATQFLKRYVEQERGHAEDKDPLFVKEDGKKLNAHALAMNFRVAAVKMGLNVAKEESNPFRPKRFRHLFRTACSNARVDPGFTMAFMGHSSNISASYLEKSDGMFLKEYVKLEPYVTVFGMEKNGVTELAEEMRALSEKVEERDFKIKRLEDQVSELTASISLLKKLPPDIRKKFIDKEPIK
jgi:integrase